MCVSGAWKLLYILIKRIKTKINFKRRKFEMAKYYIIQLNETLNV